MERTGPGVPPPGEGQPKQRTERAEADGLPIVATARAAGWTDARVVEPGDVAGLARARAAALAARAA